MGWYERVISMDGKLQGKARSHRRLLFIINAWALPLTVALSFGSERWPTRFVVSWASCLLYAVMLGLCICRVPISNTLLRAEVALWAVFIAIMDLDLRAVGSQPVWPWFVLLADLSLVIGLGRRFTNWLIGLAAVWVTVCDLEKVYRFGLFDLPGTAPGWHRAERFSQSTSCTDYPCRVSLYTGTHEIITSVFVLIVAYIATRGFADAAEKEKAAMARTIETVEAIAQLLAGYDVDTVAEMLQEAEAEGRLPAAMHEALQRLEQNLRAYRPYLPEALFEQLHRDDPLSGRRLIAPGARTGEAALVFTDVRASTSIWEAAPEAMKKAMQTHNSVMRDALRKLGGYEVKTIGDAFMVAFEEARPAVDFGLTVQQRLVDVEWPAALLDLPICRRTDLWGGLTVRVGVNHGPVTMETNALTGRVDYFGHTVNMAARLEGVCPPGAVAVPADLWAQVSTACLPAAASAEVPTDLKGVSEPVPLRNLWPHVLAGRQRYSLQEQEWSDISSENPRSTRAVRMREQDATIGAVSMCTVQRSPVCTCISESLEAVMPLLQQSRGTLITLLGEHVFVGWNLVHAVPVHAENAVSFAQRVLRSPSGADVTMGLASGTVHHGDVGTSTQRFVTAAGLTVNASLQVWRAARDAGVRCLYTTADADRPLGALQAVLRISSVVCSDVVRPGEVSVIGTTYEIAATHED